MNFDLSITISAIVAVCATVSPIFTALINNRHQYKMRKLELQHESEETRQKYHQQVYDNYLRSAGAVTHLSTRENLTRYGESAALAFCYAPEAARLEMQAFEQLLLETADGEAEKMQVLNRLAVILEPTREKQARQKRFPWNKKDTSGCRDQASA